MAVILLPAKVSYGESNLEAEAKSNSLSQLVGGIKEGLNMFKGCMGRILHVDLSSGKIKEEVPDKQLYHDFLGGYGVGARILFSRQKPGADPLGPDNTLGFVTGLLTGTPVPLGCRYVVVAKSPLVSRIAAC